MLARKILSFDWAFWFQWIMATTVGWFAGGLLFSAIPLISSGVGIAILQWLVLVGRIPRAWRWVVAGATGWTAGALAVLLWVPAEFGILSGFVLGLATGTAQWLILRQELHWAGWWIVFSVMGWITGLALLPGMLLTGTMSGALTGVALELLLRTPKGEWIQHSNSASRVR